MGLALNPNGLLANRRPFDSFDEGRIIRTSAIQRAELIALEQRYPNLIHSQQAIKTAEERLLCSQHEFSQHLLRNIEPADMKQALEIIVGISGLIAAGAATNGAAFVYGAGGLSLSLMGGKELTQKMGSKFNQIVSPVVNSYSHLQKMLLENRLASYSQCQINGYQPKLEIDPSYVDTHKVKLIDKANPNPNEIVVVMHE